jgi:hypothetical protein
MPQYDAEVRTKSIPTAAHLIIAGFEPLGALRGDDGSTIIRFSSAARAVLEQFLFTKQRLDATFDAETMAVQR